MLLGMPLSQWLLLATGGLFGLAAVAVGRRRPQAALVGWLLVVAFVPFWAGLSLGAYLQPGSLAGIAVVVAYLSITRFRAQPADVVVVVFFVACVIPVALGGGTRSTVFGALAVWLVAYLVGRLAPTVVDMAWIQSAVVGVLAVVAVLAVVEFVADWHPYRDFGPGNALKSTWAPIQIRGGVARSEWAFGHSIALGATLASAVPLAATATRLRPVVRALVLAALIPGVVVSVSRISMVCALLGLVLAVVFGGRLMERSMRLILVVLGLAGVGVAAPFVLGVIGDSGDEASRSAAYRGDLIDLLSTFAPLGRSPGMQVAPDGSVYYHGFQSIDSQLIFTGLTYGAIPLAVGVALLLAAVTVTLARRATPATLSVVAQIPALAVVSLITQYSLWFWFLVGLSIASHVAAARPPEPKNRPLVVPGRTPVVR